MSIYPEQWAAIFAAAPVEQLGVQYLAQGHLSCGFEAVHSLPPPRIPAGPRLELLAFRLDHDFPTKECLQNSTNVLAGVAHASASWMFYSQRQAQPGGPSLSISALGEDGGEPPWLPLVSCSGASGWCGANRSLWSTTRLPRPGIRTRKTTSEILSRISPGPCQWWVSLGDNPRFLWGQNTHTLSPGLRIGPWARLSYARFWQAPASYRASLASWWTVLRRSFNRLK